MSLYYSPIIKGQTESMFLVPEQESVLRSWSNICKWSEVGGIKIRSDAASGRK